MGVQRARSTILKSVHISGANHYKIRNNKKIFIFSGVKKRQFEDIENAKVVGYFTDKPSETEFEGNRLFQIRKGSRGRTDKLNFDIYPTHKRMRRTVCYVPIGNNEFLVYEKTPIFAIAAPVATFVLAAGLGYLAFAGKMPAFPENPLRVNSGVAIGGDGVEEPTGNEMIDFAGYDEVSVSSGSPYVLLQNPETNDVYFSYVISDNNGKEIMTTDLIPPGRALQWAAGKDLGSGTHSVTMHVDTYDMNDTSIPYNTMSYEDVKVHVN